ncbi:DUF2637 domain-containing protein [Streptomyces sp. cg36]|uniref:DUF2637 domain-containing protein n=1 Tax=Streptomyces sp. cg36 TaxID=3238798 RepID=UPI0034E1CBA1
MSTISVAPAVPSPLSRAEKFLLGLLIPAGGGVGGLGLAASFSSVSAAASRWGFKDPWMLPIGIDLAIPVFTVANLLLIRVGMPLAWVRWVPWGLTLVTCWLNIAAGESASARVAHGSMPLLWVVLGEVVAHVYAVRVGVATGTRMERVRRSRWLFAPCSTLLLWRRMVLWEITDYREALALEKDRQLVRAELRTVYGRFWRRTAPRRDLVLLKLGELPPEASGPPPSEEPPQHPPRRRHRAGRPSPRMTWDEALIKAQELTSSWPYERLDADPIRRAVGCSQSRSRELRDALRSERTAQRPAPLETAAPPPETSL